MPAKGRDHVLLRFSFSGTSPQPATRIPECAPVVMTLDEYNRFCRKLPHTSHVVQWGGAHVWKVAGKVFAICWDGGGDDLAVTFKCSPMSYDLLREVPGCQPAPYLASRGMKWIQRFDDTSLDDADLRDYLAASHRLVASGLPKKRQKELGLLEETGRLPSGRRDHPRP